MLDPKLLREDFEGVLKGLSTRGIPEGFERFPELDQRARGIRTEVEELRAQKNKLGPAIAKGKKEGTDVAELLSELKGIGEQEKSLNEELQQLEAELEQMQLLVPNLPHESVPIGAGEEENREEKTWGAIPEFSFEPKPHWDVGEQLGILDFETAANISGARFAVYRGDAARLERALVSYMLDQHRESGYLEIMPPYLVRSHALVGSGQLPKFEEDLFKTADFDPQLFLIPTAEVPLCNLHAGQILEASELPKYYTAFTPCFRAEAGSYGKDVRGLIRQHQFHKVELVKLTDAETSMEELEKLTRDAESILEKLELPYRRMTLSSGDMGMAAAKTYDLEVWLPGLGTYREISSCSNTLEFQARRNKTRYRTEKGAKPRFVHMLNGSGLAVGRTLVAILENYQQEDGSVRIPEVLRPYLGGQELIS